ncbi:hypothetical protein BkAM31D_09655 [Halalkalibacter krulwichiae]|uniref:Uncharacterized protein n=1 Tax=Halalkalibacter krulwichiae TaxID=199441 RepID=A0A1X9M9L2_9BACI|nr:hypothetical protein BkAM31D_09655 [Halalkalibacter krulwichiae]
MWGIITTTGAIGKGLLLKPYVYTTYGIVGVILHSTKLILERILCLLQIQIFFYYYE